MVQTIKNHSEVKAIKEHICNFCNDKILIGEIYIKSVHVNDGELYDWKAHWYCNELASKLDMYKDADDGVTDQMFQETIHSVHDDLLIQMFSEDEINKYSEVVQQLRKVKFRDKLLYVIRKLEIKKQK